ncbi:MAG: EamA family transporter [Desulfobacteraceae bacterium 4572_123]|nr:MAG: EamA family transporter [Desulfobacteraceae bacterium 4572_123]
MLIYIKLLLTAFFWGGTFVAGRIIAGNVGPCSAAFLRFLIASIFLYFLARGAEGKIPLIHSRQIVTVVLVGLTGVFAYNILFFKGLQLIEAGRAALIIAINPILIALFSALFFKEKLGIIRLVGIIISITGAIIVISRGDIASFFNEGLGIGEILIFGCVASWVAFSLIGKTIVGSLSPLVSIFYSSTIGTLALFVPAYHEGLFSDWKHYVPADWLSLFFLAFFGTVVGFVWYYEGIKAIGPTKAGLFINFVPVSAIFLAWLLLAEPVSMSLVVGAAFVSIGVYMTNSVKTG